MVQFLNTTTAYSEIENIINRAERKLVLISPYVPMSRLLLQRLYHVSEHRGVKITLVCRKKDLKPEAYSILNKISGLEIFNLPDIHAKCFYNEKAMVLTSLNLYEYSQTNNREMGVLITQEKDSDVFNDAVNEAELIVQLAYKTEADNVIARLDREPATSGDVSFFDIEAGLKRSFPTFAKILARKKEPVA